MFVKKRNRIVFTLWALITVALPFGALSTYANSESSAKAVKIDTNAESKLKKDDSPLGPYTVHLLKTVKSNWFPPKGYESKRATVCFDIKRDGTIKNVKLKKSTGNATADIAAIEAVKKSAPFDALPKGSARSIAIEFIFDYNVFEHGKILSEK